MAKRAKGKSKAAPAIVPSPALSVQERLRRHVGLILLGVGLMKLASAAGATIEHFDEGVYASNFWFGAREGFTYPLRWFYAPPFQAWVVENLFLITVPLDFTAMLPSGFCALMSVLFCGIAAKRWGYPPAGWVAILTGILSGYFTAFAQTALTDVPLGMWWLVTLLCLSQGCVSGKLIWGIAAGVACSAAWWTKYNGWMPLGIGAAGLVVASVLSPELRKGRSWLILGIAIVTAAGLWSPYLWSLQGVGGYAAINANHRGYMVGLSGWPQSAWRQWRNFEQLNGIAWGAGALMLGWCLAFALSVEQSFRTEENGARTPIPWKRLAGPFLAVTAILGLTIATSGYVLPMLALTICCLCEFVRDARAKRLTPEQILGGSFLGVWFVGMGIATPLYTPYARLLVPWFLATWIGGSIKIGSLATGLVEGVRKGRLQGARLKFLWVVAVCMSLALGISGGVPGVGWNGNLRAFRTSAIRGVTQQILETIRLETAKGNGTGEPVLLVHGDPALFFQLKLATTRRPAESALPMPNLERWVIAPIGDLSFASQPLPENSPPMWLILGRQGSRDEKLLKEIQERGGRLESVGIFGFNGSDYVMLDQYSAGALNRDPGLRKETVHLYRMVSGK